MFDWLIIFMMATMMATNRYWLQNNIFFSRGKKEDEKA